MGMWDSLMEPHRSKFTKQGPASTILSLHLAKACLGYVPQIYRLPVSSSFPSQAIRHHSKKTQSKRVTTRKPKSFTCVRTSMFRKCKRDPMISVDRSVLLTPELSQSKHCLAIGRWDYSSTIKGHAELQFWFPFCISTTLAAYTSPNINHKG